MGTHGFNANIHPGDPPDPRILTSVSEDLGRLDQILADAIGQLLISFSEIQTMAAQNRTRDIERAAQEAVTALQFQDMASQLIAHCRKKLADPESGSSESFSATHFTSTQILRHIGPVSQSQFGEGSIELF